MQPRIVTIGGGFPGIYWRDECRLGASAIEATAAIGSIFLHSRFRPRPPRRNNVHFWSTAESRIPRQRGWLKGEIVVPHKLKPYVGMALNKDFCPKVESQLLLWNKLLWLRSRKRPLPARVVRAYPRRRWPGRGPG
jgi:hypothetical protein